MRHRHDRHYLLLLTGLAALAASLTFAQNGLTLLGVGHGPAAVGGAAPVTVQHNGNVATTGSTVAATFGVAVGAAHRLGVCVGVNNSATINTPTMTGETLVAVAGATISGTLGKVACYLSNSTVGGQTVVTEAGTGCSGCGWHIVAVEISGANATPTDATGTVNSATYSVATSGSTTHANDLVLAFMYDDSGGTTFTQGAGYALLEQNTFTSNNTMFSESKTVAATGTQTATATSTGGNVAAQAIIAIAGTP